MNIFNSAPEFIEWDNRKDREINRVTAESTYNRLSIQLPKWLVKDATVLDLGSCLGAAGHMALTNGASHYTGVEIQDKYVADSTLILSKYWNVTQFTIIQQNLEDFLDNCIAKNIKFDVVVASGVLYAFLNIITILEKISMVSNNTVLIDTIFVYHPNRGMILIREDIGMVYAEGPKTFTGIGSSCNIIALDIIMKTKGFYRTEDPLIPPAILNSHDGYSDILEQVPGAPKGPSRYAARYYKKSNPTTKLIDSVLNNDMTQVRDFYTVPNVVESVKDKTWTFDTAVAERFQHEAITNIPDYSRVIELCLEFSKQNLKTTDAIIDIGSALGYTVDQFVQYGFDNIIGLDSSEAMVAKSLHPKKIVLGDTIPNQLFKLILINWTLHFIADKHTYLQDLYNKLEHDGYLIVSDKTTQTPEVKSLYYDFKRANGVTQEYINEKEKKLSGYMHTMPISWYITQLEKIGFSHIEIINAKHGFVTFLCKK